MFIPSFNPYTITKELSIIIYYHLIFKERKISHREVKSLILELDFPDLQDFA